MLATTHRTGAVQTTAVTALAAVALLLSLLVSTVGGGPSPEPYAVPIEAPEPAAPLPLEPPVSK